MTASRLVAWRPVWASGLLALLLAVGVVPAAWANTITVDGNCTDSNLADAVCDDAVTYRTIAGAAAAANANDTIDIVTSPAHTEIGVTLTKTLTIQGQGAGTTIWQGAAAPGIAATRLVTINPGIQVTMTALTLQYGNVTGAGGAIYNRRGTLTLTSLNVLTNTATGGGGAIYNEGALTAAAHIAISDTVFTGNRTLDTTFTALGGGALWNYGNNGTAIANITNSEFVSNTAGTGGGAIYSSNASGGTATLRVVGTDFYRNLGQDDFYGGGGAIKFTANGGTNGATIESSQFISNTTGGGGGAIRLFGDAGTATLTISGTTFSLNTGLDGFYSGGALFVDNDSTTVTTITNSEFLTNTTAGGGGAIYQKVNSGTATLTITATLLRGNVAQEDFYGGGAIRNFSAAGVGTLYLIDSQVLTNTTNAGGGAIHNDAYLGTAITHISGSDLISNTAVVVGGAVWNDALDAGSVAVTNILSSTLAYNTALDGGGIYNDAYNRDGGATTTRATVLMTDTVLYANQAIGGGSNGGAVFSGATDTGAFALFTAHNSTLSGHSAAGSAAIYNYINNRDNFTTTLSATASAVMVGSPGTELEFAL